MNSWKFLGLVLVVLFIIGVSTRSKDSVNPSSPQEINKDYFSAWDGSNPELVSAVKNSMNDPESFEHVETRYNDNGANLEIKMKFRGKNGFGGVVSNTVIADFEKSTRTISNIKKIQ